MEKSSHATNMRRPGGRLRRHRRPLIFAICIIAVIALAVGLGVGLTRHSSSSSSSSSSTGGSTPSPTTTTIPPTGSSTPSACPSATASPIVISNTPQSTAGQTLLSAFVSFAIEFGHFPDFAGNISNPNTFSNNLLNNIGNLTGTKPYIRVGGNSADQALLNQDIPGAVLRTASSPQWPYDPKIIDIGEAFFESYSTWPDTKFIHGFNLGLCATNGSDGLSSLLATVPLACAALGNGKLLWWEFGNEPDLYTGSGGGKPLREPGTWGDNLYVNQWLNGTQQIKSSLQQACPDMVSAENYGYVGPSFWVPSNGDMSASGVFSSGLNTAQDIKLVTFHNYIASDTGDGVSLQGTLLNHTNTVASLSQQLSGYSFLSSSSSSPSIPLILGETNSLYNTGTAGITDTFGAALWTLDYSLAAAARSISRVHMQQGTDFLYNAWQPLTTANVAIGTKAPYYGNIAVAAMVGNATTTGGEVRIAEIDLGTGVAADGTQTAYAAYVNGTLARIALVNMRVYDSQDDSTSRGDQSYVFSVPGSTSTVWSVRRLLASGSDAVSGVTWDGYSYEYDLAAGMPVLLGNVTRGESVAACAGVLGVVVQDSSAVVLEAM